MRQLLLHKNNIFFLLFMVLALPTKAGNRYAHLQDDKDNIQGKWDITIYEDDKEIPSWVEIYHSGVKRLVGQYVGSTGSARPISEVSYDNGVLTFSLPPQWETEDNDVTYMGVLNNGKLSGLMTEPNGKTYAWTAVRAPLLLPEKTPSWGKSITLFNGKDLSGWKPMGANNQWVVTNGVLKSPHSGVNLITERKFNDFKLHIEFKCPKGSNSGIYLRGRHEVQIIDSKGQNPEKDLMGAIYGFITPNKMAALDASEWQSYDITLVGRLVTVVLNGETIICNQPIPGITGGALDSHEGEPGPIYLQGDHGPIEFRNIVITPAK